MTGKSAHRVRAAHRRAGRRARTVRLRAFANDDAHAQRCKVNDNKDINGKLDRGLVDRRAHGAGRPAQGRRERAARCSRRRRASSSRGCRSAATTPRRRRRRDAKFYDAGAKALRAAEGRRDDAGSSRCPTRPSSPAISSDGSCTVNVRRDRRGRPDRRGQAQPAPARRSISPRSPARPRASISTAPAAPRPQLANAALVGPRRGRRASSAATPPKYVVFVDHGLAARRSRARVQPEGAARDAELGQARRDRRRCS